MKGSRKQALEELKRFATVVTQGVADSAVFCQLFSANIDKDPVPVVQMGYAMLLDKPIVVLVPRSCQHKVPMNVRRVAVALEVYEDDNLDDLQAATLRALGKAGLGPRRM